MFLGLQAYFGCYLVMSVPMLVRFSLSLIRYAAHLLSFEVEDSLALQSALVKVLMPSFNYVHFLLLDTSAMCSLCSSFLQFYFT